MFDSRHGVPVSDPRISFLLVERLDQLAVDEQAAATSTPACPPDISPEAWAAAAAIFTEGGGDLGTPISLVALRAIAREREREAEGRAVAAPALRRRRVREAIPYVTTRLLAERGFWTLAPTAHGTLFEWDDLEGILEVHPSADTPVPGVFEALVMGVIVSRWASGPRDPARPDVAISVSAIADSLELPPSGPNLARITQAIESLKRTSYRFVVQAGEEGYADEFNLLDRVRTRWQGSPTSPNRRISAHLSTVVLEALLERRRIRPVDISTLRALGEQRELARRLFLFLESRPGHNEGDGWDRIEHTIDARLGHTLGTVAELKILRRQLLRAADAIMNVAEDRYAISVIPRRAREIAPGEPRYLLRARRRRERP